ncbi:uncharacterized protein LOC106654446 [Trichogramma pretiosum]|uniref:uncharacterized protein LOC106654446 n=1 Tax=Trichogramma pretiosum TaxID=7493 RepID=UPI0006C97943|nr:uncharacterized protein LOC106654446 [Trichogramma pretiosum]
MSPAPSNSEKRSPSRRSRSTRTRRRGMRAIDASTNRQPLLHVAAQHRRRDDVKKLLENGVKSNERDRRYRSTALHALARLNLSECATSCDVCTSGVRASDIVDALIEKEANIEARDRNGDTPLQLAVSRLNVEVARALLGKRADPSALNEDRMFGMNFNRMEFKDYCPTLKIIEMMELFQSSGYRMDTHTRLRVIKYWMKVKRNDTKYLLLSSNDGIRPMMIVTIRLFYDRSEFYLENQVSDFLNQKYEELGPRMSTLYDAFKDIIFKQLDTEMSILRGIQLINGVSLYEICKMNYDRAYSIVKNLKSWRVPPLHKLTMCTQMIVKRHLANIFIRLHLELLATDLFMSDDCKLNLPYTVCRIVAEKMSREDLFHLFEG